jgi:tetratricopeptide (TPR) repeat protein
MRLGGQIVAGIVLAGALSWAAVAFAQSPELMAAHRQYKSLNAQGRYAEAETFVRKALDLGRAEFGPDSPVFAAFLNNLALLYSRQGRYNEAESLYKRAQVINKMSLSPNHPGLAKAFFYAGSRALLVSHWPVASDATVAITTRMMEEARRPGVGRAEALRRAMLALIRDEKNPHYAHPYYWAPFVVVGEGGIVRSK